MKELQLGKEAALEKLIERWELPIKAYLYRFTGDSAWVDELAQETFIKLYYNCSKFKLERRFSPWIYAIASNLAKNWMRWRARRPEARLSISRESGEYLEPADPEQKTPAESIAKREQGEAIKQQVAELPAKLRTAVILYYYQGLSYEEIAEVLGCSIRGVETRLYRARKQLERKLSGLNDANSSR